MGQSDDDNDDYGGSGSEGLTGRPPVRGLASLGKNKLDCAFFCRASFLRRLFRCVIRNLLFFVFAFFFLTGDNVFVWFCYDCVYMCVYI